jgi:hypothetical protein
MGYAILVGYLRGWNEGIADAMEAPLPESAVDEARALRGRVVDAMELRRALADGGDAEGKGALDAVADLRPELGFFADVVGPDAAAQAMPMLGVMLTAGCWYLLAFLGGLTSLVVLAVLLLTRKMIPVFAPAPTAHAALVLGETFVLWIALFLMLQVLMGVLGAALGDALGSSGQLLLSLVAMFGSLAALAYPRMRGVSWSALRELIGLHAGRGIVRETLAGLHCYVTAVPLLAIGLVIFAILSAIVSAIQGPSPSSAAQARSRCCSSSPLRASRRRSSRRSPSADFSTGTCVARSRRTSAWSRRWSPRSRRAWCSRSSIRRACCSCRRSVASRSGSASSANCAAAWWRRWWRTA